MEAKTRKKRGVANQRPDVAKFGRYTIAEAAEKMGASVRAMRNWFNDGLLKPVNYNVSPIRITGQEITRFWEWKTGKR